MTIQDLEQVEIQRGSVELVKATVTADVTLDDTVTVEMSLTPASTGVHAWLPAEWAGTADTTREARTTDTVTYAAGAYTVFVRLTDLPEVPILAAYDVTVPSP